MRANVTVQFILNSCSKFVVNTHDDINNHNKNSNNNTTINGM